MKLGSKQLGVSKLISWVIIIAIFFAPMSIMARESDGFDVGKEYHGFKLVEEKKIAEIDSIARVFEHVKSGARLIHLENQDENKVFGISFRTPQDEATGIPHILEHSLLDGSKKYPVKSPFLEMNKRSLATLLNAFTTSDHTYYPIATRNQKDFNNLMDVYLDAVFHPNLLKEDKIFRQEGWHYSLDSVEDDITYNGVVYNEMKGNYSNPQRVLIEEIYKSLYPDTIYSKDSGGDPEEIPNLTYEEFTNFYKAYYHPSNSYIYLYGNLDLLDTLAFIDKEYLDEYAKKEIDSTISLQESFEQRVYQTVEYNLPESADPTNKDYLSLNYTIDEVTNKENVLAFSILSGLLTDTENSPLRQALLEAGLGTNAYGYYNSRMQQPSYSIIVENGAVENKQVFEELVEKTLKEIVENGFDQEFVNSILGSIELQLRREKSDVDRGIGYMSSVLMGWIYDADPTLYLTMEEELEKIKNQIDDQYFEQLIQKYLLDNTHSSMVVMKAVPGLEKQKEERLKEKLRVVKESLSKEELLDLVEQTQALKAWKEAPNSEQALETLPSLTLEDIDSTWKPIPIKKEEINGVTVLNHPLYTNKIAYMNMYFDTTKVPQEQLPYLYLLSGLLARVDTENYHYQELTNELFSNVGSLNFSVGAYEKYQDDQVYYPKMTLTTYTLTENLEKVFDLLEELIHKSSFEDVERLHDLVVQMKGNMEYQINSNGLNIAATQLGSYFSPAMQYQNVSGLPFYEFITEIEKELRENPAAVIENLQEVYALAFQKENLIASITVDEEEYDQFTEVFRPFANNLKTVSQPSNEYDFTNSSTKQGIVNGEKIQYVAQGYNYKKLGYEYSGKMQVLRNILSTEYLWNEVRVKGGAYGAIIQIGDTGTLIMASYRDPKLKETLEAYKNIPKFLREFDADEEEMTNYIIGTLGNYDPLLDPAGKGRLSDSMYITQQSEEEMEKEMTQILGTTAQDIRDYATFIENVIEQNNYCVVGNESKIQENKEIFEEIINVFQTKESDQPEMVKAREALEGLGAKVSWNAEDPQNPIIIAEVGEIKVEFLVNTNIVQFFGQRVEINSNTIVENGTAYIPKQGIDVFVQVLQAVQAQAK